MNKAIVAIAITAVLGVASACAEDSKVTLKVTGMTCEACAPPVEKSLKKLKGVKAAEVSYAKGQAMVTFDPAKVTPDKLIAAVAKAGGSEHSFKAQLAEQFKCGSCGKTYDKAGTCCGAPTKKVN
jgi:copper chaperone CopZ